MSRSLSETEHRALQAARDAVLDRRAEGRMFDRPMITAGEVLVMRAVIRSLRELPPTILAVAEGGHGDTFEDRWKRVIDAISPEDA